MNTPVHALIIDDDSNNLAVLGRLLTNVGATHTAIQNSATVEAALQQIAPVDVVFLDLEMPYMDGYALFEVLKRHLDPQVPIVACSVHTNELETAHELGFHSFLGKPLDLNRFPMQFESILNGQSVWE